jgi:DNA-binding NarL/FixJ family response regulator
MEPLRILLVDDNPEFLEAAARFLSIDPWLQIVGMARSGGEGLALIEQMQPNLLLVDLSMPDMTGIEMARQIKTCQEPPRVIVMTIHDEPEYRSAVARSTADGFILKTAFPTEIRPLITTLFDIPESVPTSIQPLP